MNNKTYRILSLSLILVLSAFLLTGCGTTDESLNAEEKLAEISDDLDSALDEEINEDDLEIDAVGNDEVEDLGEIF